MLLRWVDEQMALEAASASAKQQDHPKSMKMES